MIIRVIKADDCKKCKALLGELDKAGLKYETYDGTDPKNDAQLDIWNINEMPIVQFLDNDKVVFQLSSGLSRSLFAIRFKLQELEKGKK